MKQPALKQVMKLGRLLSKLGINSEARSIPDGSGKREKDGERVTLHDRPREGTPRQLDHSQIRSLREHLDLNPAHGLWHA